MIRSIALLSLFALLPARSADAAIVIFMGDIASGTGTELGNVPPVFEFGMTLDFTPVTADYATIHSGMFTSSVADVEVVGGDIVLFNGGTIANFTINTNSPAGSFTTSFMGAPIPDLTSENIVSLIDASSPTAISATFASGSTYIGRVNSAAVPEPSSGILVCGAASVWLFRRRKNAG